MPILSLLLGIALPSFLGWIFLRHIEGKSIRFFLAERLALSWMMGLAILLSVSFTLNILLSVPFSFVGFFGTWLVLVAIFFVAAVFRKIHVFVPSAKPVGDSQRPRRWIKIALILLLVWTGVKVCIGAAMMAGTPAYFDDTIKNWNSRGKVYFYTQNYEVKLPIDEGVNGYPPYVPLAKTWISTINGDWNEGASNLLHIVWFLSGAVLVWALLRRLTESSWALFGAYAYISLPLVFMHGVSAYADISLSVFAFIAIGYLSLGLKDRDNAYLALSAVAAGLLPFIKNEGLLLYVSTFIAIAVVASLASVWKKHMTIHSLVKSQVLPFALSFIVLSLPFILFKIMNGLAFGNAKGVSGLELGWHDGVVFAMTVNMFFEGNWLLFFPVLLLLLAWKWKHVVRLPLWPIALFCAMLMVGQMLIFIFTPLAIEALRQTGFSRGIVQLMPLLTVLGVVLLSRVFHKEA